MVENESPQTVNNADEPTVVVNTAVECSVRNNALTNNKYRMIDERALLSLAKFVSATVAPVWKSADISVKPLIQITNPSTGVQLPCNSKESPVQNKLTWLYSSEASVFFSDGAVMMMMILHSRVSGDPKATARRDIPAAHQSLTHEHQAGFQLGRSYVDHMSTLREVREQRRMYRRSTILVLFNFVVDEIMRQTLDGLQSPGVQVVAGENLEDLDTHQYQVIPVWEEKQLVVFEGTNIEISQHGCTWVRIPVVHPDLDRTTKVLDQRLTQKPDLSVAMFGGKRQCIILSKEQVVTHVRYLEIDFGLPKTVSAG
ncbi:hypothetical protein CLF_111720 [Clonorchis sinensis]|uniref:Uncharacterized protein n=1 Tax=Clonorchis sinensis TaxID=79923 RepID=G7YV83_CLOSI|nr:hypothetical protein CLF_111720 [Clonorchis sinensis]